jgi:hypothetical protein
MDIAINLWAVLGAAVAAFLFGWAWHSPLLFVKPWMRLMGYRSMDDAMHGASVTPLQGMLLNAVATLVLAYVLAHFSLAWGVIDIMSALDLAFWVWLGFMVPIMLNGVLWERKSWALFCFNAVYQFVTIALMSIIIGLWY